MRAPTYIGWDSVASRRVFVKQIAGGLVTAAVAQSLSARVLETLPPDRSAPAAHSTLLPPVVSFHLDQPYLDMTGRGIPYRPPPGMRSGQPVAELSEHAFRSALPYA